MQQAPPQSAHGIRSMGVTLMLLWGDPFGRGFLGAHKQVSRISHLLSYPTTFIGLLVHL
jgi:hypothetical protein